MPDEPTGPTVPTPASEADAKNPNAAFLPIGIVFLVLGLSGLSNDSMRGTSYAFIPVGITFLILSARPGKKGGGGAEVQDPPGPDVTPR
jgi:hypothetical protein